jgi:hypothetical protein
MAGAGAEQASHRTSIVVNLGDEWAGFFRLTEGPAAAEADMNDVVALGIQIAFDGYNIVFDDDSSIDPGYLNHSAAGWAMVGLGPFIDGFPNLWNGWIASNGANDGVVPWSNQQMPFSTAIFRTGFSHTEETTDGFAIAQQVDAMNGR